MKIVYKDKNVYFYDEFDNIVMSMGAVGAEGVWTFYSAEVIKIVEDDELYPLLEDFMSQDYEFFDSVLKDNKEKDYLVWHSDVGYDPDSASSIASVPSLHIKKINDEFHLWCERDLDEMYDIKTTFFRVAFSPAGNGRTTRNLRANLTLQEDFMIKVYNKIFMRYNDFKEGVVLRKKQKKIGGLNGKKI